MKRSPILLLAALLVFSHAPIAPGQDKPLAALGRIASIGEVSESQKGIILTRVESILSRAYDLISRDQYARAEEAAFAALNLEQCTAEQCIRKIQEILQVERLFVLQIIAEPGLTQLSLNLIKADSKRVVETICERCSTVQLYGKIENLARQLIAEDLAIDLKAMVAAEPEPKPSIPFETELAQIVPEEEEGISIWWWILGGLALAGLAAAASSGDEASTPPAATSPTSTPSTGPVSFNY